jgi:hypothetical protein
MLEKHSRTGLPHFLSRPRLATVRTPEGETAMPYVRRSPDGLITALLAEQEPTIQEYLPATHPEVCAFLGHPLPHNFSGLDAEFIRVMEDLIDVLTDKNLLRITDLPAEAQRKLLARKDMRKRMKGALDLIGDDDII